MQKKLVKYVSENKKCPFDEWFKGLKDKKAKAIVDARLIRLRTGNYGNYKDLGNGLKELKIPFGPGYRIYFSDITDVMVLLLLAGDKGSQNKDIAQAKKYLKLYKRKNNNDEL